ncbi:Lysine/ornithine decarboxylase [compost metagenome]
MNTLYVQNYSVKDELYHDICSWVGRSARGAVLLYDLNKVGALYEALTVMLPGVRNLFAVKSAPCPELLSFLDSLGCGFEIAGEGELALLQRLGIGTSACLFTNPINSPELIERCIRSGVKTFVADNLFELHKYEPYRGQCELVIRIAIRNHATRMDLSKKFGCAPEEASALLEAAGSRGLTVKGLSFHVGSNVTSSEKYVYALNVCHELIREQRHHDLRLLDIGGGFPIFTDESPEDMTEFFAPVREALARFEGMDIVSEPGRFLSGPGGILAVRVMGKNVKNGKRWYYLNEGVYGAFSGKVFDYASYPVSVFGSGEERIYESVLAGPTCDSFDIIEEDILLPELEIGDVLLVHNIGAYSCASMTGFNGVEPCTVRASDDPDNPVIRHSRKDIPIMRRIYSEQLHARRGL